MLRQLRRAHQELITFASDGTTFIDRPDNERLAAAHVTRSEDTFDTSLKFTVFGLHVRASVGVRANSSAMVASGPRIPWQAASSA